MVTTATVQLYNDDWDFQMRAGVPVPRDWTDNFATQFLQHPPSDQAPGYTTGEPIDHIIGWIKWIQKALDSGVEKNHQNEQGTGSGA